MVQVLVMLQTKVRGSTAGSRSPGNTAATQVETTDTRVNDTLSVVIYTITTKMQWLEKTPATMINVSELLVGVAELWLMVEKSLDSRKYEDLTHHWHDVLLLGRRRHNTGHNTSQHQ